MKHFTVPFVRLSFALLRPGKLERRAALGKHGDTQHQTDCREEVRRHSSLHHRHNRQTETLTRRRGDANRRAPRQNSTDIKKYLFIIPYILHGIIYI